MNNQRRCFFLPRSLSQHGDDSTINQARQYQLDQEKICSWLLEAFGINKNMASRLTTQMARAGAGVLRAISYQIDDDPEGVIEKFQPLITSALIVSNHKKPIPQDELIKQLSSILGPELFPRFDEGFKFK